MDLTSIELFKSLHTVFLSCSHDHAPLVTKLPRRVLEYPQDKSGSIQILKGKSYSLSATILGGIF